MAVNVLKRYSPIILLVDAIKCLHSTGMMHNCGSENKIEISFVCTVSGNISHNPGAIWTQLHRIFSSIHENFPKVKVLHVFSDGPATQYRRKQNFYLINTKLFSYYNVTKVTLKIF